MDNKLIKKYSFKDYLTYLPGVLIFIGLLKLILFYLFFGIRIVDYLEITEIILTLVDLKILFLVIISILSSIYIYKNTKFLRYLYGEVNKRRIEVENKANSDEDSYLNFQKFEDDMKTSLIRLETITGKIINFFKYFSIATGLLALSIIIVCFFFINEYLANLFYGTSIASVVSLIYMYYFDGLQTEDEANKNNIWITFLIALLFLIVVFSPTIFDVKSIKFGKKYFGTEIYLDTEKGFSDSNKIICDSNNNYIGQTKNFIFLYSINKNTTTVIPKSKVGRIIFKNGFN